MVSAYYLNEALNEAQKADPKEVRPNPLVGAIVVDENQRIVGRGFHMKFATPHAEVHAIADAVKNSANLSTCTLYVTLEPCSHHGKTPPCTDLILHHGIKKVVVGSLDPNPLVSGVELLRAKGVEVELHIIDQIEKMNRVFFVNQSEQRPYFQFKLAVTSDGVYGHKYQSRFWITGPQAAIYVHEKLRSTSDAILSTAKSVIHDNAKLNIRLNGNEVEKTTILLDQYLSILQPQNTHLSILAARKYSKLILVTTLEAPIISPFPYIEILVIPKNNMNQFSLQALAKELYKRGYFKVLIEAGGTLFSSLLEAQLIDDLQLFVSNKELKSDLDYIFFQQLDKWLMDADQFGFGDCQKVQLGQDNLYQFSSLVRNRT